MATYTDNYQLTKPLYSEVADIATINNNMDKVDDIMHNSQISLADAYDQTQTYELGEKVMYEMLLYRCISRIETPEVWNPSHWERTTAADEGGNYVDVDEKFQTGLNVADVDIDGDQHYIKVPYMTGATSQADGAGGLVPAPEAGDEDKFYKGDGTWGDVAGSAEDIDYDNTESGLVADNVQGAIDEVVSMIPSLPTVYGEASGAIASFNDGTANPLEEFVIGIEPVQAGTGDPSPQNERPLYGWTGANIYRTADNIWDEQWEKGVYDTSGIKVSANNRICSSNKLSVVPSGSYYTTTRIQVCEYDANENFIVRNNFYNANSSFTVGANTHYIAFHCETSYGTTYLNDISINYPSTDTTYHAHTGSIIPISWQTEAGTVYGGELDVTNGVMKITDVCKIPSASEMTFQNGFLYVDFADSKTGYELDDSSELLCNLYKTQPASTDTRIINRWEDYSIGRRITGTNRIVIKDSTMTSENYTEKMASCYICYKLATPITIQLTPTQVSSILGVNNIWADTGDVINCKYIRDLNSTINLLWNAVFNQSNTRSLSMMKSVKSEDTDTKEVEEEIEDEETEKEIQKEGNDENQR